MKIHLVTPAPLRVNNGNKITALRWAKIFRSLGHRVRVMRRYNGAPCDVLIALHARRSAESIRQFHATHPNRSLILVLTGTDLYRDIRRNRKAKQSLELATQIVVLQKMALLDLPRHLHGKTQVIYQSAEPFKSKPIAARRFQVCVIGHLRKEKDPLRTAFALRRLPVNSRIRLIHIGLALDGRLGEKVQAEARKNGRIRWLGHLSHRRTRALLARSQLLCISSKMEGSSNVLSEALASGVPVVATRIRGLMGTLGKEFPGYFPVGDTKRLARLLLKAETDRKFYLALKRHCARAAKLVQPKRERADWKHLLQRVD